MKQPLNDDQLNNIAGGNGVDIPVPHFSKGDNVTLFEHPECGIGIVLSVILKEKEWMVTARFDKGIIEAPELEFIPA